MVPIINYGSTEGGSVNDAYVENDEYIQDEETKPAGEEEGKKDSKRAIKG